MLEIIKGINFETRNKLIKLTNLYAIGKLISGFILNNSIIRCYNVKLSANAFKYRHMFSEIFKENLGSIDLIAQHYEIYNNTSPAEEDIVDCLIEMNELENLKRVIELLVNV